MARPSVTINATVFASSVGVDRAVETDVGRIVVRDDRARALDRHLRLERPRVLLLGRPAVVECFALDRLEAPLDEGARAAHEGDFAFAVFGHVIGPYNRPVASLTPILYKCTVPIATSDCSLRVRRCCSRTIRR